MAVGKNKRLSKGKKGLKKKIVDPFTRKDWFDIKAPSMFDVRQVGKTLANRTQGLKKVEDSLKDRVLEVSLADLSSKADEHREDRAFRKIQLQVQEIQGKDALTNFYSMDMATDKLRSMVRKWQTTIEAFLDVKTTDGYLLRLFVISFTRRQRNQVKKTSYAQSSKIKEIRKKMFEIIEKEISTCDLKEAVNKFTKTHISTGDSHNAEGQDIIAAAIEKKCKGIYPLYNTYVRKVKILKAPKFDVQSLLALHGGGASQDEAGSKVKDFVEPQVQDSV